MNLIITITIFCILGNEVPFAEEAAELTQLIKQASTGTVSNGESTQNTNVPNDIQHMDEKLDFLSKTFAAFNGYDNVSPSTITPGPLPTESVDEIVGGFHIIAVNYSLKLRFIRIYWQRPTNFYFSSVRVTQYVNDQPLFSRILPQTSRNIMALSYFDHTTFLIEYVDDTDDERPTQGTVVKVPAHDQIIEPPKAIVIHEEGGKYRLLWKRPKNDVINYTIFWGDTFDYDLNGFLGILDHKYLPHDATDFNWQTSRYKARAISVNSGTSTSGLVRPAKEIAKKEVAVFDFEKPNQIGAANIEITCSLRYPEIFDVFDRCKATYMASCCQVDAKEGENSCSLQFVKDGGTSAKIIFFNLKENTSYRIVVTSTVLFDGDDSESFADNITVRTKEDTLLKFKVKN